MSDEKKPREFWIPIYRTGKTKFWAYMDEPYSSASDDVVHVIEKSAYDELKAQVEVFAENYRLINLANEEWTRNDAITFGKLYEEIGQLKAQAEKYRAALESIETLDTPNGPWTPLECFAKCQAIAREALNE